MESGSHSSKSSSNNLAGRLLSLPYLGFCEKADEAYQRTRSMLLTPESNPWYFKGKAGESASGLWLCRTLVRSRL